MPASDRSAHRAAPRLSACAIGLPPSLASRCACVADRRQGARDAIARLAGPRCRSRAHNRDFRRCRSAGGGADRKGQCVPVRNRGRGTRSRDPQFCAYGTSVRCAHEMHGAEAVPPDQAVARLIADAAAGEDRRPPRSDATDRCAVGAHCPSCQRKCGRQPRRTCHAVAWPDGARRRFACPCGARTRTGDAQLRWQALRQCLALDAATGLPLLERIAKDHADPLCQAAWALLAQLQHERPSLLSEPG